MYSIQDDNHTPKNLKFTTPLLPRRAVRLLVWLGVGAVVLFILPFFMENRPLHHSLVWNLFLAALPLVFCLPLLWRDSRGKRGPFSALWWALWFIFYPNAPYMLTDLIHIGRYNYYDQTGFLPGAGEWLGMAHIVCAVAIGVVVGNLSFYYLHRLVTRRQGPAAGWLFVTTISLATGIGLYIGRFLRFNTWDIVRRPAELLYQLSLHLGLRSAAFSLLFAAMTMGSYLLFYLCWNRRPETKQPDPAFPKSAQHKA